MLTCRSGQIRNLEIQRELPLNIQALHLLCLPVAQLPQLDHSIRSTSEDMLIEPGGGGRWNGEGGDRVAGVGFESDGALEFCARLSSPRADLA
jgi:hypothetical protein